MRMVSMGVEVERSKFTKRAWDSSRRPWPVPSGDDGSAYSRPEDDDSFAAAAVAEAGASRSRFGSAFEYGSGAACIAIGGTYEGLRLYNATPITPTLSGRPVRAAYESPRDVK